LVRRVSVPKLFRYRNCSGTETVPAPELFRYRNCFGTETVPHPPGGRWQTAGQACRPHVFVRGLSRNFTIPGRGPSVSGPKQTETGHDRSQLGFWGTETAGIRRRVRRQFRCRDSFGTETVSVPKLWRTLQCNDTGLQGIPCPQHKTTMNCKVFHARYTERHWITRYSMPTAQDDTELQGIPCPLHKTTRDYKVFQARCTKRH